MQPVWQIGGGDFAHDYTKLCLDHDVMLRGPGDYGRFEEEKYRREIRPGGETRFTVGTLRSFLEDPKPADIVLLRYGYRVLAIGIIAEEGYDFQDTFDDVFGWHLGHIRRVIWQNQLKPALDDIQKKRNNQEKNDLFSGRKQIPTFTAVRDANVLDRISDLFSQCKPRPLKDLPPPPPKPLEMEEVGQELFSKGIPNDSVDKVLVAIERQRRLVKWYWMYGRDSWRPSEHEIVAHMILPLLLALGWSEQLLAVEWHRVDLACFWGTPTTKERCVMVCEAKWLGHGLQNTFDQAKHYVDKLNLKECRKILVTDGARLYLYEKPEGLDWNHTPVGYLNVNRVRTNHIAPANTNAVDTIVALTPAGVTR